MVENVSLVGPMSYLKRVGVGDALGVGTVSVLSDPGVLRKLHLRVFGIPLTAKSVGSHLSRSYLLPKV